MTNRSLYSRHIRLVALLALSFLVSACGGSSGGTSASAVSGGSSGVVSGNFSGSVIDGPVVGATLRFYDKDNNLIKTITSDVYANYSTSIKVKGKAYPLTIEVEGGTDLVTGRELDFRLSSFIPRPTKKQVNITPFTTLIVESARSMPGGVNNDNIAAATAVVMDKFNFGSDPDFVADPFGTGFTDGNVAITLLSSEALGEMIRRVRDRLRTTGVAVSADDVIGAIADDIADGMIDGVGGSRAQGRITAIVRLVSAQVLVEALSNNLKVDGARAADKLDAASAAMRPSAPVSAMTEFVRISSEMLMQVRTDVAAARTLAPGVELTAIANTLDTIQAGSLPADIEPLLPIDSSADLDPAISLALTATDEQLVAVNSVDSPDVTPGGGEPVNSAPVLTGIAASFVPEDSNYLFQPVATDADGDALTFTIRNRPGWAVFNRDTGRLSGTPKNGDVGVYSNIAITVSDAAASDSIDPFSITVLNTNDAPAISGTASTSVNAGVRYSFQPSASDPDGDSLVFSILNPPAWAAFNSSTGHLSGTPDNGDAGTYSNIKISVSDGSVSRGLSAFSISVNAILPSNRAPAISGSPATSVAEDNAYFFQPVASDADGDNLTFSISTRPSWASFNTGTGRLSGTPDNNDVGFYSNIMITVNDGSASASLGPFNITVRNTNDAPVISGSPATGVDANSAYSFQPMASDVDGDGLTFSIQNRPSWASFNTSTGRLSGTPTDSDVLTYSNIAISVSDGVAAASLGTFSIQVRAINQTGSVTLSWTAPVARSDGTPLSLADIAGFRVYYSASPGSYPYSIEVADGSATSVTVTNIPVGTSYMVMTTYDNGDRESAYSPEISKIVQ